MDSSGSHDSLGDMDTSFRRPDLPQPVVTASTAGAAMHLVGGAMGGPVAHLSRVARGRRGGGRWRSLGLARVRFRRAAQVQDERLVDADS